jgi:DNA-binding LacI/PurR family transcriptional regulator
MKDISKHANVALATVSAVINESAYVSPELKARVLKAIEEFNYRPNAVARSLKKKSTNTVGVIVSDILNPYYPAIVKGMDDVAIQNNMSLILCNTSDERKRFLTYLEIMMEKRVDGLLLCNISNNDDLQEVEKTGLNYVLVNRKPPFYDKSFVGINNDLSTELAVKHLASLGYKRIAYFSGDMGISTARERLSGFRNAMEQNDLQIDHSIVYEGAYTQESGFRIAQNMLQQVKQLPDAICASSDLVAFGAIKALKAAGLKVPQDIAVVGNDDNLFSEDFIIPLSTINHPTFDMGKLAMEFFLESIQGEKRDLHKQIILTPSLVIRESCGYYLNT